MFGLKLRTRTEDLKMYTENISLPPLILDPVWIELFPKDKKNKKIQYLEQRIKDLMKEEARLRERKKSLSYAKRKDMTSIMMLTTAAYEKNSDKAKSAMHDKRKRILQSNKLHKLIDKKLEDIGVEIDRLNTELLTETVIISYDLMKSSKAFVDKISPKIETLRKELFALIEQKIENEDIYTKTYNLLHRLLGKDIIDSFDREKGSQRSSRRWWF